MKRFKLPNFTMYRVYRNAHHMSVFASALRVLRNWLLWDVYDVIRYQLKPRNWK